MEIISKMDLKFRVCMLLTSAVNLAALYSGRAYFQKEDCISAYGGVGNQFSNEKLFG